MTPGTARAGGRGHCPLFCQEEKINRSDLGRPNELELLLGGQHGRKFSSRVREKTGAGCWQVLIASPPWLKGFCCFPIITVASSTPWQLLSTTHAPGGGHGLGTLIPASSTRTEDPNLRHCSPISSSFITEGDFWQFRSSPACLNPRFG